MAKLLLMIETGFRRLWASRLRDPAPKWLKWAARAHYSEQGLASEHGNHETPRDPVVARDWFLKAAEGGHPEAMVRLADLLSWGSGGLRDPQGAVAWLERAAALGCEQAVVRLGKNGLRD